MNPSLPGPSRAQLLVQHLQVAVDIIKDENRPCKMSFIREQLRQRFPQTFRPDILEKGLKELPQISTKRKKGKTYFSFSYAA